MPRSVVLVGCGNMGSALLQGWLDRGMSAAAITVVEPDGSRARVATDRSVPVVYRPTDLPSSSPDVVVLAVKPQVVDAIAPHYARFATAGAVVLSIAAGKTIASLATHLGTKAALVRAMPNTPAAVRRGISVACGNAAADEGQRAICEQLLAAVGVVLWIDDEALMDAVTAVSGSGPAYVFLMAECLARAGVEAGLPAAMAQRLAGETIAGSGELLARSGAPPELLRRNVTSPGGTTAAALAVLMADDALQALLSRAVYAAARRSRELAS